MLEHIFSITEFAIVLTRAAISFHLDTLSSGGNILTASTTRFTKGGPSPRNMLDARNEESRRRGRASVLDPETLAVPRASGAGGRPIATLRKSLCD